MSDEVEDTEMLDWIQCYGEVSGCIQDQECTRHLGACGAPMDLQRSTQGEQVPAEYLSRNVILYKLKYVHKGDFT